MRRGNYDTQPTRAALAELEAQVSRLTRELDQERLAAQRLRKGQDKDYRTHLARPAEWDLERQPVKQRAVGPE